LEQALYVQKDPKNFLSKRVVTVAVLPNYGLNTMEVKQLKSLLLHARISVILQRLSKRNSPKFNPYSSDQLTIHKTLNDIPLCPGLSIEEFCKFVEPNTVETPIYVKNQETTRKTIFVHEIDDNFTKVVVRNDSDLKQLYEGKGEALYQLSNPKVRVTKMKQLIDGEKYHIFTQYERSFLDELQRQEEVQDEAMEEEMSSWNCYSSFNNFYCMQQHKQEKSLIQTSLANDCLFTTQWNYYRSSR
jgi:hypothetical protein